MPTAMIVSRWTSAKKPWVATTPKPTTASRWPVVLASAAARVIYHLGNAIARWRKTGADDGGPIPAVGPLGGDPT